MPAIWRRNKGKTCKAGGCSRPQDHEGGHGKITSEEIRKAVKGSNGSQADINLWHELNKPKG
jgi:hypothetical protein